MHSDELLDTLKNDAASEEFVNLRVKEIIEDCLHNDREILLDKLQN